MIAGIRAVCFTAFSRSEYEMALTFQAWLIELITILPIHHGETGCVGRKFEKLAKDILECCWLKDRYQTSEMLVREAPNWGNLTVMSMAYNGELKEFLAEPACYAKLHKIWRGDIALRTNMGWVCS